MSASSPMPHPDISSVSSPSRQIVLCDFDGTLIRTDSLHEALLSLLKARPYLIFVLPFMLLRGRPFFKHYVFSRALPLMDAALLPVNTPLIDQLREQKMLGAQLHLISATPQFALEALLKALSLRSLFDSVHGSSATLNLKGSAKLRFIHEHFPGKFSYAGDSRADLKIWQDKDCSAALLCGPLAYSLASCLPQRPQGSDTLYPPPDQHGFKTWLSALRIHQWAKNALIFVPLFTAYLYTEPGALLSVCLAFLSFGAAASGTYILNDLLDLDADRAHPSKRHRPFACAALPITQGLALAVLLLATSLSTALCLLPAAFTLVLCAYLMLTLAYSLRLKRLPVLDIAVLAVLYTLRLYAGCAALSISTSYWLLAFSIMLFLSLACLKRYTELQGKVKTGADAAARLKGRGYVPADLDLILGLGLTTFTASVLMLGLYINSPDMLPRYRVPELLWGVQIIFFYLIGRLWLLARRGNMHDDPVFFFVRDRVSLMLIMICALITLTAHYGLPSLPLPEALP